MSRGEFVYTLSGRRYFLTSEQARVVDDASDSEPDDDKFNAWFADYARTNNIQSEEKKHAKYWSRVPDSANSVEKLALVQNAMTTLIRVVNPMIRKNQVEFKNDASTSMWKYEDDKIILPPGPSVAAATLYEAIDNTAGYAVHEAFHSKHSKQHYNEIVNKIRASRKFSDVWNAIEDMRINTLGLEENPGFHDYIRNTYNTIVQEAGYRIPNEWPPEYTNQLPALIAPFTYGIDRVGDPMGTAYKDKYLAAKKILDPWSITPTSNLTGSEIKETVQAIMDLLDDPDAANDPPPPVPNAMCSAGSGQLSEEEKESVDSLVQAELKNIEDKEFTIKEEDGNKPPDSKVLKPNFATSYKIKASSDIQKADAHLRLKKTKPRNDERFMKSGELDEDELYRLMQGDPRVFRDITEEVEESASVHFLIDVSGSMSGSIDRFGNNRKVNVAAELAYMMVHSMHKKPHVKIHVWCHTGDSPLTGAGASMSDPFRSVGGSANWINGMLIYRIWEPGDDLNRLNMITEIGRGNNYDGYAIGYVGRQLLKEEADKKYLIVLSDGQPAGDGYGGQSAIQHVRDNTDFLIRKGISVIQIAIGQGIYASQQAEMFKHYVRYENVTQTIRHLAKLLDKVR